MSKLPVVRFSRNMLRPLQDAFTNKGARLAWPPAGPRGATDLYSSLSGTCFPSPSTSSWPAGTQKSTSLPDFLPILAEVRARTCTHAGRWSEAVRG